MEKFRKLSIAVIVFLAMTGLVSASTNVALNKPVTLTGDFFTNGWGSGLIVDGNTTTDGIFFPRQTQWDQGPVWWDNNHDGSSPVKRYITIELQNNYSIESFVIQADDNDAYILYYRDLVNKNWVKIWDVPNFDYFNGDDVFGMHTRPNPFDDAQRYNISTHIITNALKLEGNMESSDGEFAVSEIQAYGSLVGVPIPPVPEVPSIFMMLTGIVGLIWIVRRYN